MARARTGIPTHAVGGWFRQPQRDIRNRRGQSSAPVVLAIGGPIEIDVVVLGPSVNLRCDRRFAQPQMANLETCSRIEIAHLATHAIDVPKEPGASLLVTLRIEIRPIQILIIEELME